MNLRPSGYEGDFTQPADGRRPSSFQSSRVFSSSAKATEVHAGIRESPPVWTRSSQSFASRDENNREALPVRPQDAPGNLPLGDDELLTKKRILRDQFYSSTREAAQRPTFGFAPPSRGSASRGVSAFGRELVTAIATEGGSPLGATEAQRPAAPASPSPTTKSSTSSVARSSSAASL